MITLTVSVGVICYYVDANDKRVFCNQGEKSEQFSIITILQHRTINNSFLRIINFSEIIIVISYNILTKR